MAEMKMVYVTVGAMKGHKLEMPTADADQAIVDRWACEFPHAPDTTPVYDPPMTDAELQIAFEQSEIGLAKLRGEPAPPVALESASETRTMVPGDEGGLYKTRGTPTPATGKAKGSAA